MAAALPLQKYGSGYRCKNMAAALPLRKSEGFYRDFICNGPGRRCHRAATGARHRTPMKYGLLSLELVSVVVWTAVSAVLVPEMPLLAGAVLVVGAAAALLDTSAWPLSS
jgi:hypothetical protein